MPIWGKRYLVGLIRDFGVPARIRCAKRYIIGQYEALDKTKNFFCDKKIANKKPNLGDTSSQFGPLFYPKMGFLAILNIYIEIGGILQL